MLRIKASQGSRELRPNVRSNHESYVFVQFTFAIITNKRKIVNHFFMAIVEKYDFF